MVKVDKELYGFYSIISENGVVVKIIPSGFNCFEFGVYLK